MCINTTFKENRLKDSKQGENAIDIVSKNREVIDELVKSLMIQSYMTEGEIEQLFKRTVNSTEG